MIVIVFTIQFTDEYVDYIYMDVNFIKVFETLFLVAMNTMCYAHVT